ncbi:DUF2093 domain-containing protein [Sphingomonas sp. AOB5]|uniref:DUF2093 domain-containing protein n=1 Tax=Sphingomonas sp. AOB5 TaxID=3034017 RepID=UPI0023F6D12C|nr:DUF2093 domain-containing protein [Sphingomonas sp. AOB5]MDF7776222.1 DUF2093 domain-containing protein [Sphingomonas sp. AOB5]
MLNSTGPALIRYETPEFLVLRPGSWVLCAVSGERIDLEDLKYWSAEFQEAYRGAEEASAAMLAGGAAKLKKG